MRSCVVDDAEERLSRTSRYSQTYRWRLEDIYESTEDWEDAFRAVEKLIEAEAH